MKERIILERSDSDSPSNIDSDNISEYVAAIDAYKEQKKQKRKEKLYDYTFGLRTANFVRNIIIGGLIIFIAWTFITYIYFLFWVLS